MRHFLFFLALATLTQGCATIGVWDEGFPRDGLGMTDAEKKAEFNRFAIQDFGSRGKGDWVEVGKDEKGHRRRVTLVSFLPVVETVSPAAKAHIAEIEKLHENDKWAGIATGAGIAASAFGATQVVRDVGAAAMLGGVGTGVVLHKLREDQIGAIQRQYNADLMKRLYGAGSPEAARASAEPMYN